MKNFDDFGIDLRGRTDVEVKTTCPQCSAHRRKKNYPCLNVNTDRGVWHCWHCDWSGTLKAGEERRSQPAQWKATTYRRPTYTSPSAPDTKVVGWLDRRGISVDVARRAKVGFGPVYFSQTESELPALQFPYFRGGEVVNVKYRAIGEKLFRMHGGAERVLYGLDDIGKAVVVVEGEIDKLSVAMAGEWSCVSVPDGAPAVTAKDYTAKFDFLIAAEQQLAGVERFVLAVDGDMPGQKLEEELARRLGHERCFRVTWPEGCKDANDVLVKHSAAKLRECLDGAQPYPIAGIFELADISERVVAIHERGMPKAEPTGWKALQGMYSVRAGEWTVVTGIPGHGKSEWLDALMINLAKSAGWTFGVFSPENQPLERHAAKLAEKFTGKPFNPGRTPRIDRDALDNALDWLHRHVAFILPEEPTLDRILSLAKVLVFRRGIRGLIIDPWNELEHSRPRDMAETEYISACLSKIRTFARQNGVHVWIVAHPTKLSKGADGKYPVPTPYDIAGSAHWRNKADNCISVWRDFAPANRVVEVHVQKIRFKDIGRAGQMAELFYDGPSGRYYDESDAPGEVVYGLQCDA